MQDFQRLRVGFEAEPHQGPAGVRAELCGDDERREQITVRRELGAEEGRGDPGERDDGEHGRADEGERDRRAEVEPGDERLPLGIRAVFRDVFADAVRDARTHEQHEQ